MVGERKLSSITEDRKPRHDLDGVWDEGATKACLEAADWAFATRTTLMEADDGIAPDFGFQYAFEKPTDWVRTCAVSLDEYLQEPLLDYRDEGGYWWADQEEIYVSYVSDDEDYGTNYSLWTPSFINYHQAYMAAKIHPSIANSTASLEKLEKDMEKYLSGAAGKNALTRPTRILPSGQWVNSRGGGNRDQRRSPR